jgi:hypothetical protein
MTSLIYRFTVGVVVGDGAVGKVLLVQSFLAHHSNSNPSPVDVPSHILHYQRISGMLLCSCLVTIILTIVEGGVYTYWCVFLEGSKFHVDIVPFSIR